MNVISAEELKHKLDQHENIKLVNPLSEDKFRAAHIEGSVNLALQHGFQNNSIKEEIEKVVDLEDEIVVYCTDDACAASRFLYTELEKYGYENICRFSGGLRAWEEAGYTLVGDKV